MPERIIGKFWSIIDLSLKMIVGKIKVPMLCNAQLLSIKLSSVHIVYVRISNTTIEQLSNIDMCLYTKECNTPMYSYVRIISVKYVRT